MKRILFTMLTALLALAFCTYTNTTEYISPTAAFHLTVPDGWLAIDSTDVAGMINAIRTSAGMAATRPLFRKTRIG